MLYSVSQCHDSCASSNEHSRPQWTWRSQRSHGHTNIESGVGSTKSLGQASAREDNRALLATVMRTKGGFKITGSLNDCAQIVRDENTLVLCSTNARVHQSIEIVPTCVSRVDHRHESNTCCSEHGFSPCRGIECR